MPKTMAASATVREFRTKLKGFFAVYKAKGMSCMDTAAQVQLHLEDDLKFRLVRLAIAVHYTGVLPDESHGVLCCYFGKTGMRMNHPAHGLAKYEIAAKLGTETDNLHATGQILKEKSYAHVKEQDINMAVKRFQGEIVQYQPKKYFSKSALDSSIFNDELDTSSQNSVRRRVVHCNELLCTDFHPPNLSFRVTCSANLDVASLIKDLGEELGTCAHIVDARRTVHGRFILSDALPKYQWSWSCIEEVIKARKENMKLQSLESG